MSILQKAVEFTETVEGMNGIYDALNKLIDADNAIETAAAASQLIAELAITAAVQSTVRASMSMVRLGLAVSGRIWKWEAVSWAAGASSGLTAGAIIDWVNDQHYGIKLYDWLHPDSVFNDCYRNAKIPPSRDPLAIDLDADGIETLGLPTPANPFTPILFDHNADGIKTGTGWVKPDDAWLVMDRNGNGTIDSGRELFGVDTMVTAPTTVYVNGVASTRILTRTATSGFEALSQLDSNGDKVFNASDAQFANVRLWQDTNQDGISQSTELKTLTSQGITGISLTPTTTTQDLGNGNTITGTATVTRTSGATTTVGSVNMGASASNLNLADNPFYRQFPDTIALTANNLGDTGAAESKYRRRTGLREWAHLNVAT